MDFHQAFLGVSNVSETFVKDERIPLVGNLVGL